MSTEPAATPTPKPIKVQVIVDSQMVLTSIIPDHLTLDGNSQGKKFSLLPGVGFQNEIEILPGTLITTGEGDNKSKYVIVSEFTNNLPIQPPQNELIINLPMLGLSYPYGASILVDGFPIKIMQDFKAKLPTNCKITLLPGTKLQQNNMHIVLDKKCENAEIVPFIPEKINQINQDRKKT